MDKKKGKRSNYAKRNRDDEERRNEVTNEGLVGRRRKHAIASSYHLQPEMLSLLYPLKSTNSFLYLQASNQECAAHDRILFVLSGTFLHSSGLLILSSTLHGLQVLIAHSAG